MEGWPNLPRTISDVIGRRKLERLVSEGRREVSLNKMGSMVEGIREVSDGSMGCSSDSHSSLGEAFFNFPLPSLGSLSIAA
jgi:hypothetical protein